jgi:hypothetical protein
LLGIGGIEDVKLGMAFDRSESHPQNFGAQTRTTHAEQENVFEAGLSYFFRELLEGVDVRKLLLDDREPSEPVAFVCASP